MFKYGQGKDSLDILEDLYMQREQDKLEKSLIILKIIKFISKNTDMFDKEGISFIIGKSSKLKDFPNMSFALEQLKGLGQHLHHSKLDITMHKSI